MTAWQHSSSSPMISRRSALRRTMERLVFYLRRARFVPGFEFHYHVIIDLSEWLRNRRRLYSRYRGTAIYLDQLGCTEGLPMEYRLRGMFQCFYSTACLKSLCYRLLSVQMKLSPSHQRSSTVALLTIHLLSPTRSLRLLYRPPLPAHAPSSRSRIAAIMESSCSQHS